MKPVTIKINGVPVPMFVNDYLVTSDRLDPEQVDDATVALLEVEWIEDVDVVEGSRFELADCPCCLRCRGYSGATHEPWCRLDRALTAAGLPDQARRAEMRMMLREIGRLPRVPGEE